MTLISPLVYILFSQVVYVTALAPYIFLIAILIRAVTLEGSWIGIKYYISPRWEVLMSIAVSIPCGSSEGDLTLIMSNGCVNDATTGQIK